MINKKVNISSLITENGIFSDGDWIESKDQDPNGDVRIIQLADIGDGKFINKSNRFLTYTKALDMNCTFLEDGDILLARMPNPLGRACIFNDLGQKAVTTVDIAVIRPNNTNIDSEYLKFLINSLHFRQKIQKYITGTTRKRISRKNLDKIKFDLPAYPSQKKIANLLIQIETLIVKREKSIKSLDELLWNTFLDMFGDPIINNKGWKIKPLEKFGKIITGNTPPRKEAIYYDEKYIEWIKTNNIHNTKMFLSTAKEYLSEKGLEKGRFVENGALLVTCIAGSIKSIGNASLTNRKITFNQQINAIQPNDEVNSYFLYWLFRLSRLYIQNQAEKGMKKMITKSSFEKIIFPLPPKPLQDKFAIIVKQVESTKEQYQKSLDELNELFGSLSQKAFKGELNLTKMELSQNQDESLPKIIDSQKAYDKALVTKNYESNLTHVETGSINSIPKENLETYIFDLIKSKSFIIEDIQHLFETDFTYNEVKEKVFEMLEDGTIKHTLEEYTTVTERFGEETESKNKQVKLVVSS